MTQKTGFALLKEKVPEFRNSLKMAVVVAVGVLIFLGIMTFFWWLDGLVMYGALISQLIVALIFSAFSYGHIKYAGKYRKKYGRLAYRYFFFHFVMPMLVTGNACLFHPLLVEGSALLPVWLAIVLGASHIMMRFLLASGFVVLRNNLLAVLTALISFIPFIFEARLEGE